MALGEYVSVSAQRDTEQVLVQKERWELSNMPDAEHQELVGILRGKGLSEETAERAATVGGQAVDQARTVGDRGEMPASLKASIWKWYARSRSIARK